MKKIIFQIAAVLLVSVPVLAQTVPPTVMTNLGILKVAVVNTNDSAIIFVDGSFKTKDVSAIDLDGKMIITGNFVQNATRPAFVSKEYEDANATPIVDKVSVGTFVFRSDFANGSRIHQITTENDATTHDRGFQYLAFPNIRFDTNDTIVLTSYMGIDAKTIKTMPGKAGKLLLRSEFINGKVFDASLRFPDLNTISTDVPAGEIAIERNVESYRTDQANQLYAFASPFINQRSGYFAGNWVRNPIIDANGYVLYPLANAMDANGIIYPEYYVIDPFENLLPGQPYLIRYRNSSYTYQFAQEKDLLWTGHFSTTLQNTMGTYLFNGHPYNLADIAGYVPEQILTNEPLYDHTMLAGVTTSAPRNIIVGNSYSAPLSVEKIISYLKSRSPEVRFEKYLYFFPAGQQSYMKLDMSASDVNAFPIKYIPSQSIFMVHQTGGTGGQLKFDKSLAVQAKVSNNLLSDGNTPPKYSAPVMLSVENNYMPNLLKFKVNPADNENVYDLTAVFVRSDASAGSDRYDIQKLINSDKGGFQLAMTDAANVRQQQMGVPVNTLSSNLSFRPASYGGNYVLTASNVESMTTEAVILEDTKTNIFQDLRENPVYQFETDQYDSESRFIVHFMPQVPTGRTDLTEGTINAYYDNNRSIIVHRLNEKDINSTVEIIDIQGRIILKTIVTSYPSQSIDASLASGVYIVRVTGARNYTGKVVVK